MSNKAPHPKDRAASTALRRGTRSEIKITAAPRAPPALLITIVSTVRNEARNIAHLLDSLVVQEGPIEILIVDSSSEDGTPDIVRQYEKKYDFIHVYFLGGTRGAGRNFGIKHARGEAVAFIDGDAIANPFWIHELREGLQTSDVVAGRSIQMGYKPFEDLERVELFVRGVDVTYPSSNLAYKKQVLVEIGGFDEAMVTAEDIDLNLRAVVAGHPILFRPNAIVYHRTRDSYFDFLRQAFWNGVGRKQLTMKHGSLWGAYRPFEMARRKTTFWSLLRLVIALLGYGAYKIFGGRRA